MLSDRSGKAQLRMLVAAVILALAGIAGGAVADSLVATPELAAAETCESDECERDCGWFGCDEECVDNPGESTACPMTGEDCTTTAC